jgi:hypothetical protein
MRKCKIKAGQKLWAAAYHVKEGLFEPPTDRQFIVCAATRSDLFAAIASLGMIEPSAKGIERVTIRQADAGDADQ